MVPRRSLGRLTGIDSPGGAVLRLAFVVSHNLHRRHMDESQRAMVAAKIANMPHGGAYNGGNVDSSIDESKMTQPKAAKLMNVSVPSITRAKKVITSAIPILQDMVESGDVPRPGNMLLVGTGRRNISDYQRGKLALKLEETIKARAKAKQIRKPGESVAQKSAEQTPPIQTREELAKIAGVSHDTISKIKKIEAQGSPEARPLRYVRLQRIRRRWVELDTGRPRRSPRAEASTGCASNSTAWMGVWEV